MTTGKALSTPQTMTESELEERFKSLHAAGESRNTQEAYRSAIQHYHHTWGGPLPATESDICRYLTVFSTTHKVSTLALRLAALSKVHCELGLPDPTKGATVRQLMVGIRKQRQSAPKKARPLTLSCLRAITSSLDAAANASRKALAGSGLAYAEQTHHRHTLLRATRDKALILVGFWRGFRSDELSRLEVANIVGARGGELEVYLPHSKTDRKAEGRSFPLPSLIELCPVTAYFDWIEEAGITSGPVFRSIDRFGNLGEKALTSKSLGPLLKRICEDTGLPTAGISTHSMRRGFAAFASDQNWSLHALMQYVGWENEHNANRYLPTRFDFGKLALNQNRLSDRPAFDPEEPLAIPGIAISQLPD